jgi:hypothetical protein
MVTVAEATRDFLAQRRIAVAGVSRTAGAHSGNAICERLKMFDPAADGLHKCMKWVVGFTGARPSVG